MRNMEISKGLRADIDSNQNQLKAAIRNHQVSCWCSCHHAKRTESGAAVRKRETADA